MINPIASKKAIFNFLLVTVVTVGATLQGCQQETGVKGLKLMDPAQTVQLAGSIESLVKPELADSLTLRLWGVDSLVIAPISIDIDDRGSVYYTTTNRARNSEFDIRAHPDWELPSIQLQTVEDKRAFLRKELSPENSKRNTWLKDLNGDGSHDWRDMTVEKENIFRLEDNNGDGVAEQAQLVVDDFHEEVTDVAGGVLAHGDDLFVGVGPDLWRMNDKNGDGIADEKESLSHGYGVHIGFSGHGMSGVEMGPDGRIYWQIGDIGFNGTDKNGKKWEYPNSGVIARSNPDGSDFEIFASGLRNTHEFAFDQYGNLISEDNDGDHPGEKERLVYIVNGSDAGWRSNWQYGKYRDPNNNTYKVWMEEKLWMPRHEGQAAYITPCIANYISGPAGFVYNPGSALSSKYKNTFFVAEFVGNPAKSGVHAFKLAPKGASFELGETQKILGGILPTGLDFAPDGALYVADWIDGWNPKSYGRIWKMDYIGGAALPQRQQVKALLAVDFSNKKEEELGTLLTNEDMRVRQKAQFELVKRGAAGVRVFQKALGQTVHQLARVHAIWGISQLARQEEKQGQLLLPLLRDKDPEIRAQAAKWIGDIRYNKAGNNLIPLLKDTASRVRFFAAEALGRIAFEPSIHPLIDFLRVNNEEDAYLRHAGSLALARIGKAEPITALSAHPSRAVRMAAVVALRRMGHPGVAAFLKDTDEYIVTEAARAINDDLSIKEALPALGNLLKNTRFTKEALIRRAINANLRTGSAEGIQNLVSYASVPGNPATLRAEAIDALSTWAQPSVVDRVDGRYRGVIQRDPTMLKTAARNVFIGFLNDKDSSVRISAVKAINRLVIQEAAPSLHTILKKDQKAAVRVEALKALASLQDERISEAIRQALRDKDRSVRIAGIGLIEKLHISKELMVSLLSEVINTKTPEEKQAALLTLGRIPVQHSGKVFEGLLQQMAAGNLSPAIHLELADAIDSTRSPELIAQYQQISAAKPSGDLTAAYAGSLFGGDADRGKRIFFSHESAQCMRCHSYDDLGGNAGPRLNGIASRLTRSEILEALINPSARLAPGFGVVTLQLKDGKTLSGVLISENKGSLTVRADGRQNTVISKNQIDKRTNAASSMPDMKPILTKKEIRDVVNFLSTLKE
jgi:quinoprotein glucose dehydrogenase